MATYKRPTDIYELLRTLRRTNLTPTERAVLLTQYSYADKDGTNSRPSEETLAEDLAVSDRTIRTARKSLKSKGWLVEVQRGRNRGAMMSASVYEIVIPTHQEPVGPKPKRKAPNPLGNNQYHRRQRPTGSVLPAVQPEDSNQKPSSQPEAANHLPTGPKTAVERASVQRKVVEPEYHDPWGAAPQSGSFSTL